ncbi:DUF302 domain-containing protein [Thiobacillus sedimenti]|uniref:DUF302 domain-containing protein n=1 Tax=Thiobacillus sedimenti TaxID=3110231 RepID=A0ABZ1CF32_9PROT|nr:DUF302 domain-containing protein [Thiobacillus sp. SCUT-2]WRS37981.1 DUF302 domain-containing protein [Thiobacillus sp. SCUT-2]
MRRFFAMCALLCLPLSAVAADDFAVIFKAQGEFQDVRDQVAASIEGQGLKINHTNKIAEMLERTGKDLGMTRQVYVNGEQFEFCSAKLSREMMEADARAMVMCPYIISVYTLPNDKNVYISYRKPAPTGNPALDKVLGDVETLLTGIIRDAM